MLNIFDKNKYQKLNSANNIIILNYKNTFKIQKKHLHPSAIIFPTNSLAPLTFCRVARTVRPFFQVWTLSEKVIRLK